MSRTLLCLTLYAMTLFAQPPHPVIGSGSLETVSGEVKRVQILPGQGMPFLELQTASRLVKIQLGPIRYLMEENFNPQAGNQLSVKGFIKDGEMVAATITIPAEKRILKLRDDSGLPLWRGRMRNGGKR